MDDDDIVHLHHQCQEEEGRDEEGWEKSDVVMD